MSVQETEPSLISRIITGHIKDNNAVFVFPTDKAADTWADWTVTNSTYTGTTAVAMERFTAWDTFKTSVLAAEKKDRTSIPSLLRKLFAGNIIAENAEQAAKGKPLFSVLINADHAQEADSFTDWIAKMLPSLDGWKKKYDIWLAEQNKSDDDAENADYLTLYNRYSRYLESNKLFEPAWETAFLKNTQNSYIIFYPELLEDFADYRDQLSESGNVIFITLPESPPIRQRPAVAFFSNSRTELRRIALYIRKLHQEGVSWTDIAVNVPDIETYGPYLKREFDLYCIPATFRAGTSLTAHSAGQIFREIQECVNSDFSYDSVRTLLVDGYVPWKNRTENEALIREGKEKKCLCSYKENGTTVDTWEKSLSNIYAIPGETAAENHFALLNKKYLRLRSSLKKICTAQTFKEIRTQWFAFRSVFLDEKLFSKEADLILGRCISELTALIDIEEKYLGKNGLHIPSPYRFFVNELNNKMYVPQSCMEEVAVFPYRLAACAHYEYQFIIDASQNSLTVPYRRFPFLREAKRKALHIDDRDAASQAFIRLYAKSTAIFSASAETFGRFSIPHSYLVKTEEPDEAGNSAPVTKPTLQDLEQGDFIQQMKNSFLSGTPDEFPKQLSLQQKDSFICWSQACVQQGKENDELYSPVSTSLSQKIHELLYKKRGRKSGSTETESMHISQTDMKNFFPCPRKWIFSQVLTLEEDSLDTNLMEPYDAGNINHKILELFMTERKKSGAPLPFVGRDGTFENEDEIRAELDSYVMAAIHSPEMKFESSPLVMTVLDSQKENFRESILPFLHEFCKLFGGYIVKNAEDWFSSRPDGRQWTYIGKIDCVLCNQNGEDITIIDYKSSRAPSVQNCIVTDTGDLSDFQMPMYITLWQQNHPSNTVSNALFYTIQDRKSHYIVKSGSSDEKTTPQGFSATTVKRFEEYAACFAATAEQQPFSISKVTPYEDCVNCKFNSICRTTYQVSGRYTDQNEKHGDRR